MRDLVGRLQMAVDEPRIIISKDLQEAKRMMRELANFRSTIATTAGNDSLDTWRSQGALCLATALCVWFAERKIRNLVF